MDTAGYAVTLTDLLRNPNDILPRLKAGTVTVKRRGGEDFCMVPLRQWEALITSWRAVASDYREMQEECSCPHLHRWEDSAIPWMGFLNPGEREQCLRDLTEALMMSMETGRLSLLADTLAEWRATGLAAWDERRNRQRPGYQEDAPVLLED